MKRLSPNLTAFFSAEPQTSLSNGSYGGCIGMSADALVVDEGTESVRFDEIKSVISIALDRPRSRKITLDVYLARFMPGVFFETVKGCQVDYGVDHCRASAKEDMSISGIGPKTANSLEISAFP